MADLLGVRAWYVSDSSLKYVGGSDSFCLGVLIAHIV